MNIYNYNPTIYSKTLINLMVEVFPTEYLKKSINQRINFKSQFIQNPD